jgi:DNA polymerase-1
MRSALSARGIHLGPSLWALTGGTRPPDPEAMAALSMFAPVRRARRAARVPGEGQLALF